MDGDLGGRWLCALFGHTALTPCAVALERIGTAALEGLDALDAVETGFGEGQVGAVRGCVEEYGKLDIEVEARRAEGVGKGACEVRSTNSRDVEMNSITFYEPLFQHYTNTPTPHSGGVTTMQRY